jgi:anti-sigma28 factor (negative regulator of flagellin synthesis)
MNRNLKIVKRADRKDDAVTANGVKMSKVELQLSLLSDIERIANSQHVALMQKIERLREAIASDN